MTTENESVALAKVPGEFIVRAGSNLSPGNKPGDQCSATVTVPHPWNIGKIRVTFGWMVPRRRGSQAFWCPQSAVKVTSES